MKVRDLLLEKVAPLSWGAKGTTVGKMFVVVVVNSYMQ